MQSNRQPVVRIIDDDEEMRSSLKWVFETATLKVEAYKSFKEFQEHTDRRTPGCLILDLKLPEEDGIEILARLSRDGQPHLPVIVLTGHGEVAAAVRCMKQGALDFFQKPMKSQLLLERVREAIEVDLRRSHEVDAIDEARRRIQLLSPSERVMVDMISQGLSSKQIAAKLDLSVKTVVNRRASAMAKVNASNGPELVQIFTRAASGNPSKQTPPTQVDRID